MTFCVTALCVICNNRARSAKHTSRARNKGMKQSDTDIKNKVYVIRPLFLLLFNINEVQLSNKQV